MKERVKKVRLSEPFDVDKITIRRDRYFPNAYIVDLPLNSMPEHIWQDVFERSWKSSRHLWDRKLFVIGDRLRLVTTANEFDDKLDWIEQVIAETNKNIDEHNRLVELEEETRIKEGKQRQELWEEKARIGRMKETLRRRFAPI
jgi:hypothetical protein